MYAKFEDRDKHQAYMALYKILLNLAMNSMYHHNFILIDSQFKVKELLIDT